MSQSTVKQTFLERRSTNYAGQFATGNQLQLNIFSETDILPQDLKVGPKERFDDMYWLP